MKSQEIVYRAIRRTGPPRVPVCYCNRDLELSDVVGAGISTASGFAPSEPGETEWGYVWESLNDTMGQPRRRPLADRNAIASYAPPDPRAPGRLDYLPGVRAEHPDKLQALIALWDSYVRTNNVVLPSRSVFETLKDKLPWRVPDDPGYPPLLYKRQFIAPKHMLADPKP